MFSQFYHTHTHASTYADKRAHTHTCYANVDLDQWLRVSLLVFLVCVLAILFPCCWWQLHEPTSTMVNGHNSSRIIVLRTRITGITRCNDFIKEISRQIVSVLLLRQLKLIFSLLTFTQKHIRDNHFEYYCILVLYKSFPQ